MGLGLRTVVCLAPPLLLKTAGGPMQATEPQNAQPSRSQDSPSWAEAIQALRAEYLSNSATKLGDIADLIERLEGRPSGAALGALRTRFHGLRGPRLPYGFPACSVPGV